MNELEMPKITAMAVKSDKLSLIKSVVKPKDVAKVILDLIYGVGGLLEKGFDIYANYKDEEFLRKLATYVCSLSETSVEERCKFVEDLAAKANDHAGNVLMNMIDRLDNINKQKILAKLTIARIHDFINIETFFRLAHLLERIPYIDLQLLPQYKNDFYDESGDTELLYATGALQQSVIDANGDNKFVLSKLGCDLLKWGFDISVESQNEMKINTGVEYATEKDIDDIFDKLEWN